MTQPSRQEPPYTREYEDRLIRTARTGTEAERIEAQNTLLLLHRKMWITGLAGKVAGRAGLGKAAAEDLGQEAIIRFIDVIRDDYDPDKVQRSKPGLAGYAYVVLKRHLVRIAGRPLSETARRNKKKIRADYRKLEQELETPPAPEMIAKRLGIGVEFVEEVLFGYDNFAKAGDDYSEGGEMPPSSTTDEAVYEQRTEAEHEDVRDTWEAIHSCLRDAVSANKWIVLLVLRGTPLPGGREHRPWKTIAAELADPDAAVGQPAKGTQPLWPRLHRTWSLDHVETFRPHHPVPSEWRGVSALFTDPRHPVPALTVEMLRRWHSQQRRRFTACYPERILV